MEKIPGRQHETGVQQDLAARIRQGLDVPEETEALANGLISRDSHGPNEKTGTTKAVVDFYQAVGAEAFLTFLDSPIDDERKEALEDDMRKMATLLDLQEAEHPAAMALIAASDAELEQTLKPAVLAMISQSIEHATDKCRSPNDFNKQAENLARDLGISRDRLGEDGIKELASFLWEDAVGDLGDMLAIRSLSDKLTVSEFLRALVNDMKRGIEARERLKGELGAEQSPR